eukprot:gene15406-19505_t
MHRTAPFLRLHGARLGSKSPLHRPRSTRKIRPPPRGPRTMPETADTTERQARWFQSLKAGLERNTGLTLDQWAAIARGGPETAHRKRLAWMKAHHGLGQNHASLVLRAATANHGPLPDPASRAQALWATPASLALYEALIAVIGALPDVVMTQRKAFTAFSRTVQFAAARPLKGGGLLLGLALDPAFDPRLSPGRREAWSERLKSAVHIATAAQL